MEYCDGVTWKKLDPSEGELAELEGFKETEVYDCVLHEEACQYPAGKVVKVKGVRVNKGSDDQRGFRCQLVAQERGDGVRFGHLCAWTQSLTVVKILLSVAAERDYDFMLLDVKCAFLYGEMRRKAYTEFPRQDPRCGDWSVTGKLRKAMHGARVTPQIWGEY